MTGKKTKFQLPFKLLLLRGSPQNMPEPVPNNVFTVLQISSKSVHFRRSYSRTREHRFCAVEYFHYSPEPKRSFGRITIDITIFKLQILNYGKVFMDVALYEAGKSSK